ncbi:hypothetical protein CEXT_670561 [Caerostris extrusa]|uniref:Uncharacterized protein n=1 Tax=Caerostris extrusa TaxID=172846 RepID=A0AAV4PFT8_CAEEX|nr:hypothetical protein CEXT_670561 [Caerostris extrusa]
MEKVLTVTNNLLKAGVHLAHSISLKCKSTRLENGESRKTRSGNDVMHRQTDLNPAREDLCQKTSVSFTVVGERYLQLIALKSLREAYDISAALDA